MTAVVSTGGDTVIREAAAVSGVLGAVFKDAPVSGVIGGLTGVSGLSATVFTEQGVSGVFGGLSGVTGVSGVSGVTATM